MDLVQIQSQVSPPRQAAQHSASPGPNDLVKSCKYIETGTYFEQKGVRCCVHADIYSPVLITAEELCNGVSYDLLVQRRREHF